MGPRGHLPCTPTPTPGLSQNALGQGCGFSRRQGGTARGVRTLPWSHKPQTQRLLCRPLPREAPCPGCC